MYPFDVEYAVGTQRRDQEYRLRYDAFVEEHGWESPCAERLETDAFDPYSCSTILTHRDTGEGVACQRLILPERLPSPLVTNVERLYRSCVDAGPPGPGALSHRRWAEVSRLTIAPRFRCGSSAAVPAILAIMYATLALAVALDREALFSLSDPRLARLLRRSGLRMQPVGERIDFHGPRAVFRIDVSDVLQNVSVDWRHTLDEFVRLARFATRGSAQHLGHTTHAA